MKKKELMIPETISQDIVKKPAPLMTYAPDEWTLIEYKVTDTVLARYDFKNCYDEDGKPKAFLLSANDIREITNTARFAKEQRAAIVDNILRANSKIVRDNSEFIFNYFSSAYYERGEKGLNYLLIRPTLELIDMMNRIGTKQVQFFKYQRNLTSGVTTLYGYHLAMYILKNMFRVSWSVSLRDLKQIMHCNYKAANITSFVHRVLKRAVDEINKYEGIQISYSIEYEPREEEKEQSKVTFIVKENIKIGMRDEVAEDDVIDVLPTKSSSQPAPEVSAESEIDIHKVFTPEQLRKIEDFLRANDPTLTDDLIQMRIIGAAVFTVKAKQKKANRAECAIGWLARRYNYSM